MSELKACPFCGGKAEIISEVIPTDGEVFSSRCKCCFSRTGQYTSESAATDVWNRRTQPDNAALSIMQLKQMNKNMYNRQWVWIEVLVADDRHESAYYRVQYDYTHGRAFCCGYPGLGFSFDYNNYGTTWLAYVHKPEELESPRNSGK